MGGRKACPLLLTYTFSFFVFERLNPFVWRVNWCCPYWKLLNDLESLIAVCINTSQPEALVDQSRISIEFFSFCRIPNRFATDQGQDGSFTTRSPCLGEPFHAWSPRNSRGSRPLPHHPKSELFPPFAYHPTSLVHPPYQTDSEESEDTHPGLYGMRRGKRTIAMGQGTSASSRENRSHERSGRPILASWNLGQQS